MVNKYVDVAKLYPFASVSCGSHPIQIVKLRHPEILEYLKDSLRYLSTSKIEECSRQLHVHPAIIIGALAHNKTISYKNVHLYNDNVLGLIPEKYLHGSERVLEKIH